MATNNSNDFPQQKIVQLEILWWVFSLLIAGAVLLPIILNVESYRFLLMNIVFILAFITFTRYIFLLRFTLLARRQILKQVIIFLCIPVLFLLIQELNLFQTFIDEEGMEAVVGEMSTDKTRNIGKYIHSEYLLFAVGSIISGFILPFRLGLSIWRQRNRGTV